MGSTDPAPRVAALRILGLAALHRDSAAALVVDGAVVAAAQEERYTRVLADASFPRRAARSCLDAAGLTAGELDAVVFYEKPLRVFERVLATQLGAFPRSSRTFARSMFLWLGDRLWLRARIADELSVPPERVAFVEHQRAHAASAFYASPFERAAVLTLDDAGEWATVCLARARGTRIETLAEIGFPHSLGLWYSAFAQLLGLEPGLDEGRLEVLAAHGAPRLRDRVAATLPERPDGAFAVDTRLFRFPFDARRLWDARLAEQVGAPRPAGDPPRVSAEDPRDADLAASVQAVLEERVLALVRRLRVLAPEEVDLCLAGEVARNRSLVARVVAEGGYERVFVPPVPGDPGAAIGAAWEYVTSVAGGPRPEPLRDAWLGEAVDARAEDGARGLAGPAGARRHVAACLRDGGCAAWVRGALELGPESPAGRVLLGPADGPGAGARLLERVQRADALAPVRIAVPAERAAEWFDVPSGCPEALRRGAVSVGARPGPGRDLALPDGRAWVQAVDRELDPDLHSVLRELDGPPLAVVADFHLRGQPIVRTEADAVDAFRRSALDALVVGDRAYERA